jgi:hypothetical protein
MTFFSTLLLLLFPLVPSAPGDAADRAVSGPAAAAEAHGAEPGDPLGRLRDLYFESVQHASALEPAFAEVERLRRATHASADAEREGVLTAYRGALLTLQAKHAAWPHAKLRYVREGFAVLDAAVRTHPEAPEVRYLRLMSGYYLPSFFGRSASVREDFTALARLLPAAAGRYPPDLYASIVRFVLDHGDPPGTERRRLEQALARLG